MSTYIKLTRQRIVRSRLNVNYYDTDTKLLAALRAIAVDDDDYLFPWDSGWQVIEIENLVKGDIEQNKVNTYNRMQRCCARVTETKREVAGG